MSLAADTGHGFSRFEKRAFGVAQPPRAGVSAALHDMADDLLLLLPRTSEAVACQCAKKLVNGGLMTPRLVEIFVNRQDRASLIVLSEEVSLTSDTKIRLARTGSVPVARAIAARNDLSDALIDILLDRNDPVIDQILGEQSDTALPDGAFNVLASRALGNVALARQLLSRSDLSPQRRAALFIHATPRQRLAILRLADALAASKPQWMSETPLSDIRHWIEQGDAVALTTRLATLFGLPYAALFSLLGENSGALLAIALMAVDTPAALIRQACQAASFHRPGMPGGVEDVLETAQPATARWIMAAHATIASAAATRMSRYNGANAAPERLIA